MALDTAIADACEMLRDRAEGGRILVALAGPPGAGKSTLASQLANALGADGVAARIVPMDGFHLDDVLLDEMGWLSRKGAPYTYDLDGLRVLIERLRNQSQRDVFYPVFDRASESARSAAGRVGPNDRVIIIEGNYLLLDEPGWSEMAELFDVRIMVTAPLEELERRLLERWSGLEGGAARAKVEDNDIVNAKLVLSRSVAADLTISV